MNFRCSSFHAPLISITVVNFILRLISAVKCHLYTALLFTWTDYKTVFFPITVFACATAPARSCSSLLWCCVWVWFHQLMCNVSNQVCGRKEDKINHPWRPLPSGRVSESQAPVIRWATVACCVSMSSMYEPELVHTTLSLVAITFAHDELGGGNNVVGKALCTAAAYVCFEFGATTIIGVMDFVSVTAVIISGILTFTASHAQDFPDVEGDKITGRMTFPIYAPELSRFFTLFISIAWSIFLSWFWKVGPISTALLTGFGTYVGLRYYFWRTLEADKRSYLTFNIWLMAAHVLPLHARTSVLAF
ncbi:UbiA prenyltransferase family-domain-containing protein [Russula ochroleuca]|uniref:UbiA prenyltransferase family-domain-containing protein n=1 Tax=Russula ochroleuca TaxID=152965 RepID=A0A9P5JXK0_9AGAM|nr:UbiA prenyltransferase family-domain-containing protein [Russula ochroleuca]